MNLPWKPDDRAERMGIYPVNGMTVIKWRPIDPPPGEDRYVLLRFDDLTLNEIVIEKAAYNQGKFEVRAEGGQWIEIPPECIRGWAYPIFDPILENDPPDSGKS